jgi:hypothetical protein
MVEQKAGKASDKSGRFGEKTDFVVGEFILIYAPILFNA